MSGLNYAITEVVTPAANVRLTTKEHVRDDLKITSGADDAYIDRLIASQSAAASQYCNRTFALQTYCDTIRPQRDSRPYFLPNGRQPMFVRRTPLVSVTSVTENDVALVAGTDYEVDLQMGFIYRLDDSGNPKPWPSYKIVVTYTAGYTLPTQGKDGENCTLPPDVEDAVIRMVKARYLARDRDPFLKQESIPGVLDQTFWVDTGESGNISPDIRDLLDNYREPVVA